MTMDNVPKVQFHGVAFEVTEVIGDAVFLLDRFSAGVVFGSILDEFHTKVIIATIDDDGFGQVFGDADGNPEFSDGNVGLRPDDGACAKVYAFGHEVATDATALPVESLADGFERSSRALDHRWDSRDLVVDLSTCVIGQYIDPIINDIFRDIVFDLVGDGLVGFDNVDQDVSQVIFAALLAVVANGGANGGGWHEHDLADHPFGTGPFGAESHEGDVVVTDAFEDFQHDFGSAFDDDVFFLSCSSFCVVFVVLVVVVGIFPFGPHGSDVGFLDFDGDQALTSVLIAVSASFDFLTQSADVFPAGIGQHFECLFVFFLADEEFATFETDAFEYFEDGAEVLDIKDGSFDFEVSMVAGCLHVIQSIGWTRESIIQHAHPCVEEPIDFGLVGNIGFAVGDFGNSVSDVGRRENAKLNSNDFRSHIDLCLEKG